MADKPCPREPRLNRIPFMMSDSELEALDDWRFQNRIETRAKTIRRLCRLGIEADGLREENERLRELLASLP